MLRCVFCCTRIFHGKSPNRAINSILQLLHFTCLVRSPRRVECRKATLGLTLRHSALLDENNTSIHCIRRKNIRGGKSNVVAHLIKHTQKIRTKLQWNSKWNWRMLFIFISWLNTVQNTIICSHHFSSVKNVKNFKWSISGDDWLRKYSKLVKFATISDLKHEKEKRPKILFGFEFSTWWSQCHSVISSIAAAAPF